jgi:similar to stage IV sporulation protein
MRLDDLWAYVLGYVRIRVTGPSLERFMNMASARGHRLWGTSRKARSLECNVTVRSFRRLRKIRARTRSRIRILERHGLPFIFYGLGRRPLLVGGALFSMALLYLLSATIWFVRVEGTERFDAGLIEEIAAAMGVRPGTLKSSIDCDEVARGMVLAVNGLSWAVVELRGVVAVVRVIEKDPLEMPEVFTAPADIVAAKDGVIISLIVLAGRAMVKEGDTVHKGDTLIEGLQPAGPPPVVLPGEREQPPPMAWVVAQGLVKARVWYQAYSEVHLHTIVHRPTGRRWQHVRLELAGRSIPVIGWWNPPACLYERHTTVTTVPFWRLDERGIRILTTVYTEVVSEVRDLSPQIAEEQAKETALDMLQKRLPEGSRPVAFHFEVAVKNDIVIGVLASAEVIEDIALTQERR